MEDIIFQIYGALILALAGFVLPIIAIAMSAFPEGVIALEKAYKNEQKQAEENLEEELKKQKSKKNANYDTLSKNVAKLKSLQKNAKMRLHYLNPSRVLSKSAFTIGGSLASFFAGLYFYLQPLYIPIILFIISFALLAWAIRIFYCAIGIIIEASTEVQKIRRTSEEKALELLTVLADNSKQGDPPLFIDDKDITLYFCKEKVSSGKVYTFTVSKNYKIDVGIDNWSDIMFKKAQLGFYFPQETLIEDNARIKIYTGDNFKIVRFNFDYIQSKSQFITGGIELNFLKIGMFDVRAFIKGENLIRKIVEFKIKVID